MIDLHAADTRVFLFHGANASSNPSAAMDAVNEWLSKDRSAGAYANLRVRDISLSADGSGGIYTTIICSLGRAGAGGMGADLGAPAPEPVPPVD